MNAFWGNRGNNVVNFNFLSIFLHLKANYVCGFIVL
jgi:hypothetical protein